MSSRAPAILVLEDGRVFRGEAYGSVGETFGEAVFSTGMTGYQETLTDPSYYGQVVAQTAPQIGNTGINDEDDESRRIWVAGYVVRDPSRITSNWRAKRGLEDELAAQGIVGICGVDTRALTRHLREVGAMRVGISSRSTDADTLLARVKASPEMAGANLVDAVTTAEPYTYEAVGDTRYTVAALDLGIKRNTPRRLAERGITTTVFPADSDAETLLAGNPDAVFLSNGPGDPATADHQVSVTRKLLQRRVPVFGICFGNQILGRALGLGTYKLKYGHRGINQPVLDRLTRKVEITAHNHGFALAPPKSGEFFETEFGRVQVSHVCLNDDVVEGLTCLDVPAYSVQYHPEAAGGPHDADYLFDRLTALIDNNEGAKADA
ncbi:glutamine-hydrolyzing carbamoyl-phosphate synthase small subunit [Glycomyces sp. L485]|uniref:glutamine-hydrolyzing carbamoyl-phosphate synthase small subunit n=1 Tax=Glycomyces sp. L485 TaxID=2909235 RepID=UPI001F4B06D8|nr:glutamine-hydrolyzing carbamoyl-phosphate synthase small subunit [Glycomyces sp. L485]MCH7230062.1 glutamine-hydrolyzing carbamoyl-phosphate synthase small subunit [Glycomyces sp. L485]